MITRSINEPNNRYKYDSNTIRKYLDFFLLFIMPNKLKLGISDKNLKKIYNFVFV